VGSTLFLYGETSLIIRKVKYYMFWKLNKIHLKNLKKFHAFIVLLVM